MLLVYQYFLIILFNYLINIKLVYKNLKIYKFFKKSDFNIKKFEDN